MKYVILLFLVYSSVCHADPAPIPTELARFAVDCSVSSNSGVDQTVGSLDGKMQGTISAFQTVSDGKLQMGQVSAFNFTADFQFNITDGNAGKVTFLLQDANGAELSKDSQSLPKEGIDEASLYYTDMVSSVSVEIHCSISPQAID